MTASESFATAVNASIFLREFTFARNQFSPSPGTTEEFADNVLWLDRYLALFQIKERTPLRPNLARDRRWFLKEVRDHGSRQLRDTSEFLLRHPVIRLTNERGHQFDIQGNGPREIHRVILYSIEHPLPGDCTSMKFHRSRTTGQFMHIMRVEDYARVAVILQTPIEILRYLRFREQFLQLVLDARHRSEKWLLGRFLMSPQVGTLELDAIDEDYSTAVDRLEIDESSSRIRPLFDQMLERRVSADEGRPETDYYSLLVRYALLTRVELQSLRDRVSRAVEAARADRNVLPYRFETQAGCGFVIVPLPRELYENRQRILQNVVALNKCERRLTECVGVVIAFSSDQELSIDHVFVQFPWQRDERLIELLKDGSPFRPLRSRPVLLYNTRVG